jgi:hypothetical protein
VRIANDDEEGFALEQLGDAVVFRTNLRSARLRLRTIAVALPHALAARSVGSNGNPRVLRIEGRSARRVMSVSSDGAGQATSVALRRTIGLGWALLTPWNLTISRAWWPANALWLAVLTFPVGFFSGRSSHAAPDEPRRAFAWWPLVLVVATMAIIPAFVGLALPGAGEWTGVLLGAVGGLALGRLPTFATR